MTQSRSRSFKSGAAKLFQDMATLVNNRQGSDIQFKVGGEASTLHENQETTVNESATVTFYAHSVILRCRSRYFAAMLDEDKNWKESSKGVIYKPNLTPNTFQDILYYIYTGNLRASENIIELIAAADEMDLEELSIECQTELIRTVKYIFSDEDDSDDENENNQEIFEESTKQRIPIDVAIRTHIVPALNLASSHSLSNLSQKLLTIMLPNMSVIIKSPDFYTTFINMISSETLAKLIASDNLAMTERGIWDLALNWACHQTNLSKSAVETCLANFEDDDDNDDDDESDDEEPSDGTVISSIHLKQLKKTLAPLLPVIRFSLLGPDDYAYMAITLSYFLSRRRYVELNQYFMSTNQSGQLDAPRIESPEQIISKIIVKPTTCELLRKNIFEAGGITGCSSFKHLKFELLFRASEHGFLASTFHQRCDNKGPTLTLIRSTDGHLFGGVNFAHWLNTNSDTFSSSPLNFLFALPDGHHRKDSLIFKNVNGHYYYSACNNSGWGPIFGYYDLAIMDSANSNKSSYSQLPKSYNGNGASKTALAGAEKFAVSDYEVFTIFKK